MCTEPAARYIGVTKAARLHTAASTGNKKTCKEWVSQKKGGWTQRMVLMETQVTSYWSRYTSHSLTGVWHWSLERFPSAVIQAGMQAPQPHLPNCAVASFSGDLKHFERDIYKKQQLTLREKLDRRERCCCSLQRRITPAAHLPLSFCKHRDLGNRCMVWHTNLASFWILDETIARCNKKMQQFMLCLQDGELCLAHSASRLPAAFSSCRHLGRHLLGFQLCLSLVPQPTSPLGRKS